MGRFFQRQSSESIRWSRDVVPYLLLVLTAIIIAGAYQIRMPVTIDVGGVFDATFVRNFHEDERSGARSYRWSRDSSSIELSGVGNLTPMLLTLSMQAPPGADTSPVNVKVSVDDRFSQSIQVSGQEARYSVQVPRLAEIGNSIMIRLEAPTVRPKGDQRDLGVLVDQITVVPEGALGDPVIPPALPVISSVLEVLGLYALLRTMAVRRIISAVVAGLFIATLVAGVALARAWFPHAMPWLLGCLAAAWGVAHVRKVPELIARSLDALRERRVALVALGVILAVAFAYELWTAANVDFVGHADYADNAVVARNLVQGKGYTVDYVAQFYKPYPSSISHPADTWPLLQPTLIAPFFLILGPTTFAAKLPNLLLMLGLGVVIYCIGASVWDRRVGLGAAILTLASPYYFQMVVYPINDLAFSLFLLLTAYFLYRNVLSGPDDDSASTRWKWGSRPAYGLTGLWAGLLILAKPTGLVLLAALVVWVTLMKVTGGIRRLSAPRLAMATGVFMVSILPWALRNVVLFGSPLHSTESADAWILKYDPPWENIYRSYLNQPVDYHLLLSYGPNLVMKSIGHEYSLLAQAFTGGRLVPFLALGLAAVGVLLLPRRRYPFLALLVLLFATFAAFIPTYWHYEDRYFVGFIPWVFLFTTAGIFSAVDRTREMEGSPPRPWAALILGPLLFMTLAWPMVAAVSQAQEVYTSQTAIVLASQWIQQNTSPSDVIMTRNPWEVTFHSERKSVMIPYEDLPTIQGIAKRYGATYLQLDHLNSPDMRPALKQLYQGNEVSGFQKVYTGPGVIIYRIAQ